MDVKPAFLTLEAQLSPQCLEGLAHVGIVFVFYCCFNKLHKLRAIQIQIKVLARPFLSGGSRGKSIFLPFSSFQRLPTFLGSWPYSIFKASNGWLTLSHIPSL